MAKECVILQYWIWYLAFHTSVCEKKFFLKLDLNWHWEAAWLWQMRYWWGYQLRSPVISGRVTGSQYYWIGQQQESELMTEFYGSTHAYLRVWARGPAAEVIIFTIQPTIFMQKVFKQEVLSWAGWPISIRLNTRSNGFEPTEPSFTLAVSMQQLFDQDRWNSALTWARPCIWYLCLVHFHQVELIVIHLPAIHL